MGDVRVTIDGTDLDNGDWRRIIDWPMFVRSDEGGVEKFVIEFIIQAGSASDMDSRFKATYDDLTMRNPRFKVWLDDAEDEPTADWYQGDGRHIDMLSIVSQMPEGTHTQNKIHFALVVSANTEQPEATGGGFPTELDDLTGKSGPIELVKDYFDSERYTLTAGGAFRSSDNLGIEGPYTIDSISDNGGKMQVALESPSVVSATYEEGMNITLAGSGVSDYNGTHFVTSIAGGGATINLDTDYASAEGNVGATATVNTKNTAEENFDSGKSTILTALLETGTGGQPAATAPHMTKAKEIVDFPGERKDVLEFLLMSAPASAISGVKDSSGNAVERGLQYKIEFLGHDSWDSKFADPTVPMMAEGRFALTDTARGEDEMYKWWKDVEAEVVSNMRSISITQLGAGFVHRRSRVHVDYQTNDVFFQIFAVGRYRGTLSYSETISYSEEQPRTVWTDTEGFDHIQDRPGPAFKAATKTVTWVGDTGAEPREPSPPPGEGGFTWKLESSNLTRHDRLEDEQGKIYDTVTMSYNYIRYRLKNSGDGGGGFDSSGYYQPGTPSI